MSVAQKDGIRAAEQISYDDLYRRWEQSNWSAYAIDLSGDRQPAPIETGQRLTNDRAGGLLSIGRH
jgi:hypothetical protein